jgi:hypothetical protein
MQRGCSNFISRHGSRTKPSIIKKQTLRHNRYWKRVLFSKNMPSPKKESAKNCIIDRKQCEAMGGRMRCGDEDQARPDGSPSHARP